MNPELKDKQDFSRQNSPFSDTLSYNLIHKLLGDCGNETAQEVSSRGRTPFQLKREQQNKLHEKWDKTVRQTGESHHKSWLASTVFFFFFYLLWDTQAVKTAKLLAMRNINEPHSCHVRARAQYLFLLLFLHHLSFDTFQVCKETVTDKYGYAFCFFTMKKKKKSWRLDCNELKAVYQKNNVALNPSRRVHLWVLAAIVSLSVTQCVTEAVVHSVNSSTKVCAWKGIAFNS